MNDETSKITTKQADRLLSEFNDIFKENDSFYCNCAKKLGLSKCGLWLLYILRTESSAPTQSEICACLYLPKQTINSALKKMESDGYIELACENSRRSKKILLTADGIRLCEKTVDKVIAAERSSLDGLTPEEQKVFLSLFRKYNNLLKEHLKEIE